MKDFPTGFATQTSTLDEALFKEADAALIRQLSDKGYAVHAGLTAKYAGDIMQMCLQPSIKEYCPNDCGRRFKDLEAAKQWLAKGRAAFLLVHKTNNSLVGYGWAGRETSPHVPGGETTFAIRIGESHQGQGLSTPYLRLIIAATAAIYGARNIWLETWASDAAAVHIYHKLGCIDVNQVEDQRPTADGSTMSDTRLYMSLPNDRL